MAKITVDNSAEKFGSKVSIADLARNAFPESSDVLHIYAVQNRLEREWRFEIESLDMEYALGVHAMFKDGSAINVAAWADCCDGAGCKHCGR